MALPKYPKKPKLRKYPKQPKSTSLEVLKRYKSKVAEVQKENDKRMAEYKKAYKAVESERNQIAKLKADAARMKGKSY